MPKVQTAIKDAYQDFLPPTKYPFCVLAFKVDYSLVDVNVHPSKREVRFSKEDELRLALLEKIPEALKQKTIFDEVSINKERFPKYNRFPKKVLNLCNIMLFSVYKSVQTKETHANMTNENFIPICNILLFFSNSGTYWNTNARQIVRIERPNESLEFVFANIQIFASNKIDTAFQSIDFRFKYIVNDVILDICAAGYKEYNKPRYSR